MSCGCKTYLLLECPLFCRLNKVVLKASLHSAACREKHTKQPCTNRKGDELLISKNKVVTHCAVRCRAKKDLAEMPNGGTTTNSWIMQHQQLYTVRPYTFARSQLVTDSNPRGEPHTSSS